mgnify:CR=1 FL=1
MANHNYYGAATSPSKNTIQHWKYIKREKVNGKWKYYYDDSELKKYEKGVTDKSRTESGKNVITTETTYKQTDDLLDGESSATVWGGTSKHTYTTKSQGKLSRAVAKGEKKVYDLLYNENAKKARKRKASEYINDAKNWVKKLFK